MQTAANGIKRVSVALFGTMVPSALAGLAALSLRDVLDEVIVGVRAGAPVAPASALVAALALLGLLTIGWLLLGVVLEVLARVPGVLGRSAAAASAALSPRIVRRTVALVLGVGVGAGVSGGGAQAAPAGLVVAVHEVLGPAVGAGGSASDVGGLPDPTWAPPPDPGWTPEPPRVRPHPDLGVLSGRVAGADDSSHEAVVQRGDSLWVIAARHLGPDASDAEVAAEWPRWYAANRGVVGPDPDLLRPGQVLRAPAPQVAEATR